MPHNLEIITSLIKSAQQKGATAADAVSFVSSNVSVATRLGKLENIERSESRGFGLRVFIGKKQAIVSSTNISQESLNELAARAVSMAHLAPEDKYTGLADENLLSKSNQDLDLFDKNEPTNEELLSRASTAEQSALNVPGITNSEGADASYGQNSVAIATSLGFAAEYKTSMSSIAVAVLAGCDTKMERDYDYSSTRHQSDLESPNKIGLKAAEKTLKRLNPRRVKTCITPVVFAPQVAKSLLSTLSSAINGANVARGGTFLQQSLGKNIFKNDINIINNPHIKRGLASKPYDAEGIASHKLSLIENGVLQNWLLDIRSGNQLGLKTNGCALRGISSPPSPSCSNLYMENGKESPESLISSIKSGLYVTETFGMGINIVTGDYSQGACGLWIENGEITHAVNEITIAGSLSEMFLSAVAANDMVFRYSTNSPTLLIERMTVAGE